VSIDQDLRLGLAARLEAAAPDAGLVALLEGIEPATLTGEDLAAYVRARWRMHNRAEAQLLEGLHHLGRAEAGRTDRRPELDEFSGDELCGLLGWSRTMASRRLDLADDLFVRLPEVGDALDEGLIDEPKARTSASTRATSTTTTPTTCAGSCCPRRRSYRSVRCGSGSRKSPPRWTRTGPSAAAGAPRPGRG
jgi:hypothetical protein